MRVSEMKIGDLRRMSCGVYSYDAEGKMAPVRPVFDADGREFFNEDALYRPGRKIRESVLIVEPTDQAVRDLVQEFDEDAGDRRSELRMIDPISPEALKMIMDGRVIECPSPKPAAPVVVSMIDDDRDAFRAQVEATQAMLDESALATFSTEALTGEIHRRGLVVIAG